MVPQAGPLFQMLADHGGDVGCLVLLAFSQVMVHPVARAVLGPKGLALAALVVFNDAVGGIQDVGGGAVVLLQPNDLRAGEMLLEVQDVLDGGAAEPVDALVVVAHHADVLVAAGQQTHQMELGHAGVLILVHQYITILLLIILQHIGIFPQQKHGVIDQIVEIHGTGLFQPGGVIPVDLGQQTGLGVLRGFHGLVRADELVLHAADLTHGGFDGQELIVHQQLLVDLFHGPLLVAGVIDGEALGEAQPVGVPPQHPHTGGVEGGGVHVRAHLLAQHSGQTGLQLPCRLVGEGDGQHVPGTGVLVPQQTLQPGSKGRAGFHRGLQSCQLCFAHRPGQPVGAMGLAEADDVGDTVDQHGGLAAARARQNQERALDGKHGLFLYRVQPAKLLFNESVAVFQKLIGHVHGNSLSRPGRKFSGQPHRYALSVNIIAQSLRQKKTSLPGIRRYGHRQPA